MTKSTHSDEEIRELIAQRAYELYLQRGDGAGDQLSDWLTAEAEVLARQAAVPKSARAVEGEAPAKAAKPGAKKGARERRPTPGLA